MIACSCGCASHYEIYFFYHGKADRRPDSSGPHGRLGADLHRAADRRRSTPAATTASIFDSPVGAGAVHADVPAAAAPAARAARGSTGFDLAVLLTLRRVLRAVRHHATSRPGCGLFYPPLLYLLVQDADPRLPGRGRRGGRLDCRLPDGGARARAARARGRRGSSFTLHPSGVLDVGHRVGARRYKILHGQSIYYYSLGHGDTYGPLNYLAYVPFEAIWPGSLGLPARRPRGRRSPSTCSRSPA